MSKFHYPLIVALTLLGVFGCEGKTEKRNSILMAEAEVPRLNLPTTPGSVPYQATVDNFGQASIKLPLDVPVTGNGFGPKLLLDYYSGRESFGAPGYGWILSGQSTITRCPLTDLYDGKRRVVSQDNEDGLCLDGRRLLLISGKNLENLAEYRLYQSDYSRIIYYSDDGGFFKVWKKEGDILTFGAGLNSRKIFENQTTNAWLLNDISDRKGNGITFAYEKSSDSEIPRLKEIRYGGNSVTHVEPYRKVVFRYAASTSSRRLFSAGVEEQQNQNLTQIEMYGETLAWTYFLGQRKSEVGDFDLLESITKCFSETCYAPTVLQYQDSANLEAKGYQQRTYLDDDTDTNLLSQKYFIDLNNDGFEDLVTIYPSKRTIASQMGDADGTLGDAIVQVVDLPASWSIRSDANFLYDINRDGYVDLLTTISEQSPSVSSDKLGLYVLLGTKSGFDAPKKLYTGTNWGTDRSKTFMVVADGNNNNFPDLFIFTANGLKVLQNENGESFIDKGIVANFFTNAEGWDFSESPRYLTDVTGDGNLDIVGFGPRGVEVAKGTGPFQFESPQLWSNSFASQGPKRYGMNNHKRLLIDMNGDGLADAVGFHEEGVWVGLNTGKSFLAPELWLPELGVNQNWNELKTTRFIFDVNNDGLPDFIGLSQSRFHVYFGKGRPFKDINDAKTGFRNLTVPELSDWNKARQPIVFGDSNNDGMLDINFAKSLKGLLQIENESKKIRLRNATDGLGNIAEVVYQDSAKNGTYRRTGDFSYPLRTLPSAGLLVSQLRQSSGTGTFLTTSYKYENALMHLDGQGFLGFQKWTSVDESRSIKTVNTYSTDSSNYLASMPVKSEVFYSKGEQDHLLQSTTTDWESTKLGVANLYRVNRIKSTTDQKFDLSGKLISTTSVSQTFDEFGNIKYSKNEIKDGLIHKTVTTENKFDFDQPSEWILGRISSAKVTYEQEGKPKVIKTSEFTYDAQGLLQSEIAEPRTDFEMTTTYGRTRNKFGHVDSSVKTWSQKLGTGLNFNQTEDVENFDGEGFLDSKVNALGHEVKVVLRDPIFGKVVESKDPNGLITKNNYDDSGRLIETITPDGTKTSYAYELCNSECPALAKFVLYSQAEGGGWSKAFQDSLGRTIKNITPALNGKSIIQETEYQANGLVVRQSLPYVEGTKVQWTRVEYDELQRPKSISNPDNTVEGYEYESDKVITIDALKQKTTSIVDSEGKAHSVIDAEGGTVSYEYDSFGLLTSVEDALGNVTEAKYNVLGQRIGVVDPSSGTTTYLYNALGQIAETKDSLNQVVKNEYDSLARIKSTSRFKGGDIESQDRYEYDTQRLGLTSSISGPEFTESYHYDALGRIDSVSRNISNRDFITRYAYDQFNRQKSLTYPSGMVVSYNYDAIGNMVSIQNDKTKKKYWEALDISDGGQLSDFVDGNGVKTHTDYDSASGLIRSVSYQKKDGSLLESRTFIYKPNRNLESRNDLVTGIKESFGYDKINRLKWNTINDAPDNTFDYDPAGNITNRTDRGAYGYGESCEGKKPGPYSVTSVGPEKLCYDSKGQAVRSGDKNIKYGVNGLPSDIKSPRAAAQFVYSPAGTRVTQTIQSESSSKKSFYVGTEFEETSGPDGISQKHIIGSNLVLSVKGTDEQEIYLHRDHLGSIIASTNQFADLVERFDYDAWGMRRDSNRNELKNYSPKSSGFGFTGHEHLDDFDLIHMNGRVYDPAIGRFLSADPFLQDVGNGQSINRYSYVWNNPLNSTDPSGFFRISLKGGIKGIAGAITGIGSAAFTPGRTFENAARRFSKWIVEPRNQRMVAAIAIAAISANWGSWALETYEGWQGWAAATAISGVGGYTSGYIASDGNQDYARKSALTAMAFFAVGQSITASDSTMKVVKTAAHGVVGGISSSISGGTFESGFLSAAVSEGFTQSGLNEGVAKALDVDAGGLAYGTVASSLIGGSTSELTGSSFECGAMTAAFGRLFNEFLHPRSTIEMKAPEDEVAALYSKDVCTPSGHIIVDPIDGKSAYLVGTYNVDGQGLIADYTIENLFMAGAVAKAGVGLLATTADGFLARGFVIRAPFDIPVQRFGSMSVGRPDFWGLRIGTSRFANRTFAAIKPEWNNLSVYTQGVIPRGTPMRFGLIGNQGWRYPGGSLQFITESRGVIGQTTTIIGR